MKTFVEEYARIKKMLLWLLLSFGVVFLLRLGYELIFSSRDIVINYSQTNYVNHGYAEAEEYSGRLSSVNIATDKIKQKDIAGQDITIDQKYEKSANMEARTADFQSDNQKLRAAIDEYDAVIQSENLTGLQGQQRLTMVIGVMPDNFDTIIEDIKFIGTLQSFMVNKADKTAEFKRLLAEQETLIKTRDSYIAIKEKGGNIQDLLLLEDKILENEKALQNLGVNIDTYSTENSFCTINVALNETAGAVRQTSFKFILKSAKASFFWTVGVFIILTMLLLAALIMIILYLKLISAIKHSMVNQKPENKQPEEDK